MTVDAGCPLSPFYKKATGPGNRGHFVRVRLKEGIGLKQELSLGFHVVWHQNCFETLRVYLP